MDENTCPRAANVYIVMPLPKVLSGRPYEKVISNALYGLFAIQPAGIIPLPTSYAVSWMKKDGDSRIS